MEFTDEQFEKLVDVVQATPLVWLKRVEAQAVAERLVEAGLISWPEES